MFAVVVILVAVVLLVLVVVALGMRSMNKRESNLPPERMRELMEREERTQVRSTDEFAAHEPRMTNFSPDFSPLDEEKPKPVRTGQRGKRGVDEWGNATSDDEDEEFWASIRSDAAEGGFGAGGTVKPRQAASRPRVDDPHAATVQAPLPQRPQAAPSTPEPAAQPAAAPLAPAAGLGALVEPPSQKDLSDQRTVTFAAPTHDVMSILAPGSKPVAAEASSGSFAATSGSFPATSGSFPAASATGTGSFAAAPSAGGSFTPAAGPASDSFSAIASTGTFAVPPGLHSAPTSDPFPAYNAADALETTWQQPTPAAGTSGTTSGSWPAASPDILDDPAPAGGSWPAFEGAYSSPAPTFASYEVRPGYAAPDNDALTGPSPAVGTPTAPGRAVTPYDDVLSGGYSTPAAPATPAAWPEPPANAWPSYGEMYGSQQQQEAAARAGERRGADKDLPDYYR
ncbi:hypothetical protein [Nonomuraea sp. NPDC050310]|uniref:hypothetical protein n=1 Tax=Nonomuraea sp. NPDC050310 TaxID=3154935 RepID=UPI0033E07AFF